MNKEFISYEQALALKELGFDEFCFAYYKDIKGEKVLLDDSMNFDGECDTPLYQQAFRWFREKYGLQHCIWSGKINHIFYGYDVLNIEKQEFVVNNSEIGGGDCDCDTYEEAELACLRKLIEIVKMQQINKQD